MADDETWAMQQVFANGDEGNNQLEGGRQAAVKTGTWEYANDKSKSQEGMFSGFTAGTPEQGQIAASVWIGYSNNPVAVHSPSGSNIGGAGTPAEVWQTFIDLYEKGKPLQKFAPPAGTGNPDSGETTAPTAPPSAPTIPIQPSQPGCRPPGCQTSAAPPSQAPPTDLTASTNVLGKQVVLNWDNSGGGNGQGGVQIDWGDSNTTQGSQQGQRTHTYAPGTYTIKVTDADNPSRTVSKQVTIGP